MIIWINGPFGVGKSTLSGILSPRIDGSMIMDPELLGAYLHRFVPASPTGDHQDLEFWRSLTVHAIREMRRIYDATVIVHMSLLHPTYLDSMLGALESHGEDLLHIFLDVTETALCERIETPMIDQDPKVSAGVREWRLSRLSQAMEAKAHMPEPTLWLDTSAKSPDDLTDEVLAHLAQRATRI